MDRFDLAALIREHGAQTIAGYARNLVPAGLIHGWDFTDWRVQAAPGAIGFARYPRGAQRPPGDDTRVAALRAEIAVLTPRTEPSRHMYQPARQREAYDAQMRIDELTAELRAALAAAGTDPDLTDATELVLCVNASASEQARWEALITEWQRERPGAPTLLLMTPGFGRPVTPTTTKERV